MNKTFDIYVDSSANIPDELIRERDIRVIPYTFLFNGEEKLCYDTERPFRETAIEFYNQLRAGAETKTSLISEQTMIDALRPSLEQGNDVLFITIASGISGTHQQALKAKKELQALFPDREIHVADSANASMGQGLIALKVADLRDMGMSVSDCADWVKRNAYKINSFFTVNDLKYLRRGGRISATLAIAGTILNIKPILTADGSANAKITSYGKEKGRKKSLSALAKAFREYAVNPESQTVAITHGDCEEDALALADMIREAGAKDIIIEYYDLCTGSHVGPGTVALFFTGKDRRSPAAIAEAEKSFRAKPVTDPVK